MLGPCLSHRCGPQHGSRSETGGDRLRSDQRARVGCAVAICATASLGEASSTRSSEVTDMDVGDVTDIGAARSMPHPPANMTDATMSHPERGQHMLSIHHDRRRGSGSAPPGIERSARNHRPTQHPARSGTSELNKSKCSGTTYPGAPFAVDAARSQSLRTMP